MSKIISSRLSQVETQVDRAARRARHPGGAGHHSPGFHYFYGALDLAEYVDFRGGGVDAIDASRIPVFSVFNDSIESTSELSVEEKNEFRAAAFEQVENSFVPGYLKLIDYLDYLQPLADDNAGAWKLPNGEAYYAYKLRPGDQHRYDPR